MGEEFDAELPWLLLVHQLPAEPSRLRVKIWRRLQGVGAVAIKNSVYVLPHSAETREDFEWIRAEIVAQGGEAIVMAARAVGELSSAEIRDAVEQARQSDWQSLHQKCREALASHASALRLEGEARDHLLRQIKTLRGQAARIDRIDHLGVSGRREALAALEQLERLTDPLQGRALQQPPPRNPADYRARVWLTRPRPGVDRMASAWLIRHFIDSQARFRFADRIPQKEAVVPFDMYGVELGHQGDRVTFETLAHEFGLEDPALARLARIVHELDLRAESCSDVEASTVERLVEGLRSSFNSDDQLLEHGIALFEALYASFSG